MNFSQSTDVQQGDFAEVVLGMGCFWGAEKFLHNLPGVVDTQVGYAGGDAEEPTYRQVCSGTTGHAEVVRVLFDASRTTLEAIITAMLEAHDPTQGDRQGADVGSQYRSVIFTDQPDVAHKIIAAYQPKLTEAGFGAITTQVAPPQKFWPAEEYHQRYLWKNPEGYCPVHATGVCMIG